MKLGLPHYAFFFEPQSMCELCVVFFCPVLFCCPESARMMISLTTCTVYYVLEKQSSLAHVSVLISRNRFEKPGSMATPAT